MIEIIHEVNFLQYCSFLHFFVMYTKTEIKSGKLRAGGCCQDFALIVLEMNSESGGESPKIDRTKNRFKVFIGFAHFYKFLYFLFLI